LLRRGHNGQQRMSEALYRAPARSSPFAFVSARLIRRPVPVLAKCNTDKSENH
jgi:hypothetical protein